jgi:predicted RNA-binding Zn-ribbon protein involved in translation (DUF1610 family)
MNGRSKTCPQCGANAGSGHASGSEMGHMLHTSMHTHSAALIGASLFAAGVSLVKNHRFTCPKCGHRFFGW